MKLDKKHSVIIFDWDNTLFPTSFITEDEHVVVESIYQDMVRLIPSDNFWELDI
jgi:hypothetical protein